MTSVQGDSLLALVQEVSNQVVIVQVALALMIFSAFALLIHSWRS